VTVSDKLEEFRASKEVKSTRQLSILFDKVFFSKKIVKERALVEMPKILTSEITI
jgi:hypothetical protein